MIGYKHLLIDSLNSQGAILCGILLQVNSMAADPGLSAIFGYVDKLGTIGLLIYFLWRDKRDSRKREDKYEDDIDGLKKIKENELKARDLFYTEQLSKQKDFYENFILKHPNHEELRN